MMNMYFVKKCEEENRKKDKSMKMKYKGYEIKSVTNNIDGTICIMNKINELVQAVKQLNKEVKELKEDK